MVLHSCGLFTHSLLVFVVFLSSFLAHIFGIHQNIQQFSTLACQLLCTVWKAGRAAARVTCPRQLNGTAHYRTCKEQTDLWVCSPPFARPMEVRPLLQGVLVWTESQGWETVLKRCRHTELYISEDSCQTAPRTGG